jgi:fermentation-respiration switch protein FrsA (DUF1100 family)
MDTHQIWTTIRSIIVIAVSVYVLIVIILWLLQSHLVYFPQREVAMTPDQIGLPYEEVSFEASDGVRLSGWFIPAEDRRGVVLFCHGNAGNISHRLESILVFNRLSLDVFIFDYRGYGLSEGKPTEPGTYLDAEAAWDYLVENRHADPAGIVIFGRSLGGAVASWLAKERTPGALIVESAFTSIPDIGAEAYPFLPVRLMSRFKYSTVDHIHDVTCPILIVHSRDDELISFNHGLKIFEASNEPKDLLEISGSHNDGFLVSERKYEIGLDLFISAYIGR